MITLATLDARLNELIASRDQLISHVMQMQANVNAFNGAIDEVARLRDALADTAAAGSALAREDGVAFRDDSGEKIC